MKDLDVVDLPPSLLLNNNKLRSSIFLWISSIEVRPETGINFYSLLHLNVCS